MTTPKCKELENIIARAVALCSGKVLTLDVLPPQVVEPKPALRPLKEVLLEASVELQAGGCHGSLDHRQ